MLPLEETRKRSRPGSAHAPPQLQLPGMQVLLANAWLRLGQPAQALEPLREALEREPQNDQIRKNLAIAQAQLGLHEQAYPIITPFLERNPSDADALLIALQALYQARVEGRTIGTPSRTRRRPQPMRVRTPRRKDHNRRSWKNGPTFSADKPFETPRDFLFRLNTDEPIDLQSAFQHEQRGYASYTETICGEWVLIDVQLCHFDTPFKLA